MEKSVISSCIIKDFDNTYIYNFES
jgi:hypothetical protein